MKRALIAALLLLSAPALADAERPAIAAVYFSPGGGCTDAIVRELAAAQKSVRVQAYSFTSVPIAKALVAAAKRGVTVNVILDRSNRSSKYSAVTFLQHAGVPVVIDAKHAIAHNKVIVIDDQVVVTGSFNFTSQAETSNAENLLVLRNGALAVAYVANWERHWAHSEAP